MKSSKQELSFKRYTMKFPPTIQLLSCYEHALIFFFAKQSEINLITIAVSVTG